MQRGRQSATMLAAPPAAEHWYLGPPCISSRALVPTCVAGGKGSTRSGGRALAATGTRCRHQSAARSMMRKTVVATMKCQKGIRCYSQACDFNAALSNPSAFPVFITNWLRRSGRPFMHTHTPPWGSTASTFCCLCDTFIKSKVPAQALPAYLQDNMTIASNNMWKCGRACLTPSPDNHGYYLTVYILPAIIASICSPILPTLHSPPCPARVSACRWSQTPSASPPPPAAHTPRGRPRCVHPSKPS